LTLIRATDQPKTVVVVAVVRLIVVATRATQSISLAKHLPKYNRRRGRGFILFGVEAETLFVVLAPCGRLSPSHFESAPQGSGATIFKKNFEAAAPPR
jgi:hypothetical protein